MNKLKKCVVIGLGHFGHQLCVELGGFGVEVIAIDSSEKEVEAIRDKVALAVKLDATSIDSLEEVGVSDCDCAIVAIGENFADSLLSVTNLQELNVKKIIGRVVNPSHERILKKMDVDEIILPESLAAKQLASSLSLEGVIDSYEISGEHSVVGAVAPDWTFSKTIEDLSIEELFDIRVIALIRNGKDLGMMSLIKSSKEEVIDNPKPDAKIEKGDQIVVFGKQKNIKRFLEN
ncbi:MAG: hypothetical protein CL677_07495 [Bdellovibrionaceae bacterium]|nr:hypothetical protein [Pseudobdellovibrionaceae bacterium]|tara:strand:+ start:45147 stop:45845 length:699 start_codon:yes stop_codon:yes gene_type:complete